MKKLFLIMRCSSNQHTFTAHLSNLFYRNTYRQTSTPCTLRHTININNELQPQAEIQSAIPVNTYQPVSNMSARSNTC